MVKEEAFARLFRTSKFAQFDPKISRIYVASKMAPETVPGKCTTARDRPAFFAFKRDLHPTHYGQPLRYVRMMAQDGPYGESQVENGLGKVQVQRVVSELQRLLGLSHKNADGVAQSSLCDFSSRPVLFEDGVRIPGRVIGRRVGGGYDISIGGVMAELPASEVPPAQHFTMDDLQQHKAFYFYVRRAEVDVHGNPRIELSFRREAV